MTRTEPCGRAWCPFLACAACGWKGGDPQGALLDITAGQLGSRTNNNDGIPKTPGGML